MALKRGITTRVVSAVMLLGIVVGLGIVFAWFVTPTVERDWLVIGGILLAVFGGVGLFTTKPRRKEL